MEESSLLNLHRLALAELSALSLGDRVKVLLSKPETLHGKSCCLLSHALKADPLHGITPQPQV
jgi:hypothetical protein